MKRAFYVLGGLVIVAALVHAVHREVECRSRGGVLVKGQFDYVCVAAARAVP